MLTRIYGTAWAIAGGPRRAPAPAGGSRAARPPAAGRRARSVLVPRRDRVRASPCSIPRAGWCAGSWRTTRAAGTKRAATTSCTRPTSRSRTCSRPRAPGLVRGRHVPADAARRRHGLLPQADELPVPHPDLPQPHAELPRAAAAAVRVRDGLPLRALGRRARPHARPRAHDGRRPHLHHQGADGRGAAFAARPSSWTSSATTASTTSTWSCPPSPRRRPWAPTRNGTRPRRRCGRPPRRWTWTSSWTSGGGAFYGPKITVQAQDAIGRTWQMSTIQVDFQLPQRFDLHYAGDDGERHRPIMIHRALFGSVERFFGVLTEHYAGAFPLWLAPEQVRLAPVADRHVAHAEELAARARAAGPAPVRGRLEGVGGQEDPRGAAAEGALHPGDRRPRDGVRAATTSATAAAPSTRAWRSTASWSGSSRRTVTRRLTQSVFEDA